MTRSYCYAIRIYVRNTNIETNRHHSRFDQRAGRYMVILRNFQFCLERSFLWLSPQDRDQGGRIDDHLGSPLRSKWINCSVSGASLGENSGTDTEFLKYKPLRCLFPNFVAGGPLSNGLGV